jgi:hypothetical protein
MAPAQLIIPKRNVTWYDSGVVKKTIAFVIPILWAGCSAPPPSHAALSPMVAQQLLQFHPRAKTHLEFAKKQDRTCRYDVSLPDQGNHPDVIAVPHIMNCSGRTDNKAVDSRVEFEWNKASKRWEISYFGS